ncbi:MAG: hypothetical protein OXK21_01200, partial [Chloroflexota bacterium]|nr:hypothetical protein [Chloroflexota bacterium]
HLNLGYLWHALTVFAYLELLVGGNLIMTILRLGHANALETSAEPSNSTQVVRVDYSAGVPRHPPELAAPLR